MRALMFQGTGSDVGKSLVVAGLCRLLTRRGMRVAPFKPQNMSNNAAVTKDGGEIGRAQWLQAIACGREPSVHMNPVLLKPESDRTSQVIVRGKVAATLSAREYYAYRTRLMPTVLESYRLLAERCDIVLVEGAGSASEINLRAGDIANMGFARAAGCPVVLIGDIDRGGVIASIVGTYAVLPDDEKKLIRAFLINKFRGDVSLFENGVDAITRFTGSMCAGVVPYFPALSQLPAEDSLALQKTTAHQNTKTALHIAVLACPHIANFDDVDPLANDPSVQLTWCREGDALPGDADWVIIPGSKSTMADLRFLRAQGWDIDLSAHRRRGGRILGICGGYQMLGRTLSDPLGCEGAPSTMDGLGMLDTETIFAKEKTVTPWHGKCANGGTALEGYEIHLGVTSGNDCAHAMFENTNGKDGARSADGCVFGTYIHGLFGNDAFRRDFFFTEGHASAYAHEAHILSILDGWADILEQSLDIELLLTLAGPIAAAEALAS